MLLTMNRIGFLGIYSKLWKMTKICSQLTSTWETDPCCVVPMSFHEIGNQDKWNSCLLWLITSLRGHTKGLQKYHWAWHGKFYLGLYIICRAYKHIREFEVIYFIWDHMICQVYKYIKKCEMINVIWDNRICRFSIT